MKCGSAGKAQRERQEEEEIKGTKARNCGELTCMRRATLLQVHQGCLLYVHLVMRFIL